MSCEKETFLKVNELSAKGWMENEDEDADKKIILSLFLFERLKKETNGTKRFELKDFLATFF